MITARLMAIPPLLLLAACVAPREPSLTAAHPAERPAILLVTLDTVRADAVAPESSSAETPTLSTLAALGQRFTQAYTTAPTTLPAHSSMLTGLTPAEHGIHENSRRLGDGVETLPEQLAALGYRTIAVVSGFPLARQFGLGQGFAVYDDELPGGVERPAGEATDRALALLGESATQPMFAWVHYYDAHEPYAPPPPYADRWADDPYAGEIAYLDQELGRLVEGFERRFGHRRILVVGDHGEGRGDHGEMLHGNLLYQGTMRVPLLVAGDGIQPAVRDEPVSVREVAATVLGWARGEPAPGLLGPSRVPVLGEAMKPFLHYGWQPQVMAVSGRHKVIRAGAVELYDVIDDPGETRDLAGTVAIGGELRQALSGYPLPEEGGAGAPAADLGPEERRRLAALGYVGWEGSTRLREDAPSPRRMTALFADLDRGSALFVAHRYAEALPVFERLQALDPGNLMVAVRLAVAHSVLGQADQALQAFERARAVDPRSVDVSHYLAMHHLRAGDWQQAEPLLEAVLEAMPDRLPALRGLATVRERQGRLPEALALLRRAAALEEPPPEELLRLAAIAMATGDTSTAIGAYERVRDGQGAAFAHDLELGVLYLADRQLVVAREALDRVPAQHPERALALFKRAQVSVLLGEPDREERVREAYRTAGPEVRRLIESERLFDGIPLR